MDQTKDNKTEIEYLKKASETFKRVYERIYPTLKKQKLRLSELQSWDTCNGHELENKAKQTALILLINGQ